MQTFALRLLFVLALSAALAALAVLHGCSTHDPAVYKSRPTPGNYIQIPIPDWSLAADPTPSSCSGL